MGNFLDDLDDIVYYSYKDDKYIDFQTIMYLIDKDKTFTWRLLGKLEMPFLEYQNRRLYKFDDVISSVEIMDMIDVEKLGL
jgi:hypothetical protein